MSTEYGDGEVEDVTLATASFNVLVLATIGTGVLLVLGLMTLLLLRCYNCWKWSQYHRQKDEEAGLNGKTTIQISHSLPDLTQDMAKQEYFVQNVKENVTAKKVLRQSTLPAVPTRLETFQRQLSHRLESLTMPATPKRMKIDPIVHTLEKSRRRGNEDSIGLIQPELYKNELTRQASTDESTCNEHVGQLQYSLKYDQELETLIVKVLQAMELPAKDMNGNSDPYIKIYLLPDRKKKCQTKVHRRNLNPFFNEMFLFNIPYEELKERSLQFSVYDFDRFSRHDLIGHVIMKNILDSDLSCEMHYTMDILSPPKDKLYLGELLLSLCYLPTAGRLTVTIIKARNLRAMDITGSSDPYTKVYLMCQGKKIRKRKTSIQKSSLAPIWNESLVFDVPSQNIADVQLLFKVMDYDRVGPNEQLGCAVASKDHWVAMLDNPRRPVAQWYELVDSVVPSALPLSTLDGTSPPDSPFVKKTHRGRHLSFGCFEGTKK